MNKKLLTFIISILFLSAHNTSFAAKQKTPPPKKKKSKSNQDKKKITSCPACKNTFSKGSVPRLCDICFKCLKCKKMPRHGEKVNATKHNNKRIIFCNTCDYCCSQCKLDIAPENVSVFSDGNDIKFHCPFCKIVLSAAKKLGI